LPANFPPSGSPFLGEDLAALASRVAERADTIDAQAGVSEVGRPRATVVAAGQGNGDAMG